jgi:hypothetical protein
LMVGWLKRIHKLNMFNIQQPINLCQVESCFDLGAPG